MSVTILESGMRFGKYNKSDLFHIEKSVAYNGLGENISSVEFVLRHKNDEILMLEAKSSSPKPGNQLDFDEFIDDAYRKFAHSIDLYFSLVLKRLEDLGNDMPEYFKVADYSSARIDLLLVINGHKIEWLPPISDALSEKLKRHRKMWKLGFTVMNHEQAKDYGLLEQ